MASPASSNEHHGQERRRYPRVRVLSALSGYGVEIDQSVTITDVSVGGFALESLVEFTAGGDYTFLIATREGEETLVQCQCRHARMTRATAGTMVCVAGFEFLPQPEANLRLVIDTIERLQKSPRR